MKLDYSITSPEERNKVVQQILEDFEARNEEPSESYLEILGNYLVLCMEKQERKERQILTDNRLATVYKRETSYEGLVSQFENGEDGIYNLITENKETILQPKVKITQKDLEDIQPLRQLREAIDYWESKQKSATGHDAYVIKHTLIDLRKDQYIIKDAYRKPIIFKKLTRSGPNAITLDAQESVDENGNVVARGVSLMCPEVCSAILCNYSALKENGIEHFDEDTWDLIYDFERTTDAALAPFPMYLRLLEYKIDGLQNLEIQEKLQQEFGIKHSIEYISSLWRKKIPYLIASKAEDMFLTWYYTEVERGTYKRCSKCGEIKLAHNKYFSRNKTSKDTFYSICKACRNAKKREPGQNLEIEI